MCWTVLSRDVTATRAGNVLPQLCSFGVDWKEAEIFGIFMLCKITPTCCFEHCVCQAPERRLSVFVCYHLLALRVTWRKAWTHCHHIHGFLTRYHFTNWIVFQSHHLWFQGEAGEPWWGLARPSTSSHGHMWWLNLRTFGLLFLPLCTKSFNNPKCHIPRPQDNKHLHSSQRNV